MLHFDSNTRVYTLWGGVEWPEGRKDKKGRIIFCMSMCLHGDGQRLTSPHLRRYNSWRRLQHHKSKASTAREQLAHLQIIVIINHGDFTPFSGPLWRLSGQAAPAPGTRGSGPVCAERFHEPHFDAASARCWVAHNAQPGVRHGRLIHPAYSFCIINTLNSLFKFWKNVDDFECTGYSKFLSLYVRCCKSCA